MLAVVPLCLGLALLIGLACAPRAARPEVTLRIGTGVAADGSLVGEGTSFPVGPQVLIAMAEFASLRASDAFRYRLHQGRKVIYESAVLGAEEFGVPERPGRYSLWFGLPYLAGYTPGIYRVQLYLNSELVATETFKILPEGSVGFYGNLDRRAVGLVPGPVRGAGGALAGARGPCGLLLRFTVRSALVDHLSPDHR